MRKIKPGTLAIFNIDRPCADMVAVVTKITKDKIFGRYLCGKKHCEPWCAGDDKEERVTPLSEFCVEIEFDLENSRINTYQCAPSEARYWYGERSIREWQAGQSDVGLITSAKQRRWARWALNKQIARTNFLEDAARIKARVAKRVTNPHA